MADTIVCLLLEVVRKDGGKFCAGQVTIYST